MDDDAHDIGIDAGSFDFVIADINILVFVFPDVGIIEIDARIAKIRHLITIGPTNDDMKARNHDIAG